MVSTPTFESHWAKTHTKTAHKFESNPNNTAINSFSNQSNSLFSHPPTPSQEHEYQLNGSNPGESHEDDDDDDDEDNDELDRNMELDSQFIQHIRQQLDQIIDQIIDEHDGPSG